MRVLVVGGTGFLGARVVARLSHRGHEVAVYHRGVTEGALPFGVRHVHSPDAAAPVVSFPAELTEIAWDVVLAASPSGEPDAGALMKSFRGIARRVVALSSAAVSGAAEPEVVERAVLSDPELPGTVVRLPALYGPGDPRHRLRPFWRRMARGLPEIVLGRAEARFRCTHGYVDDVAEAVVLAVSKERAKGLIYEVGEAETPPMAKRVEALGKAIGWEGRVVEIDDERLPPRLAAPTGAFRQDVVFDTSRIRSELDWKEVVSPEEAFRRTAAWEESGPGPESEPSEEEDRREVEAASSLPFPDSLCHACAAPPKYVRTRRSTFIFCPLFRRYPPQPVFECPKFLPREGLA